MPTIRNYEPSYSHMKAKMQQNIREDMYFKMLLAADEMMFEYTNLPESIDPKFLEDYMNISGGVGIARGNEGYLLCPYPCRAGNLDQYGDGDILEGATRNGEVVRGKIGENAVIIYNTSSRAVQWDIPVDSEGFANIDKSAGINVLFARIAPVFACPDDKTQNAIKLLISNVLDGNLQTVVDTGTYDALALGEAAGLKTIDVTEPERIQYIQYLSEYYDALMRRHFSRRGLSLRTGTKAAQQSRDEIYGMDSVSWFLPLNKLAARRKGIETFNRIFGEKVQVNFSEIWAQEYAAYQLRILNQDAETETEMQEMTVHQTEAETVSEVTENADS